MKEVIRMFFNPFIETFRYLDIKNPNFSSKIAHETYITYAHLSKKLILLENYGFVTSVRMGRKRLYKLTKKGEELKKNIMSVITILNQVGEENGNNEERRQLCPF